MTMEGIGLFAGVKAKMDFINKGQRVVSQNIANADTPGYQPMALKDADFSRILEKSMDQRGPGGKMVPAATSAGHISGMVGVNKGGFKVTAHTSPYEVSGTGNGVVLEEQMIQANRYMMDYNLMNRIMKKNVGMIKKAIGSPVGN